MNRFKVGDRVRAYDSFPMVGTVSSVSEQGVTVITDKNTRIFHYKQCRKLIKKYRRKMWVNSEGLDILLKLIEGTDHGSAISLEPEYGLGWIEFVEVKKK